MRRNGLNESMVWMASILLAACTTEQPPPRRTIPVKTVYRPAPPKRLRVGLKAPSIHCPFGEPVVKSAAEKIIVTLAREGYALGYSPRRKTALWVCEAVSRAQLELGDYAKREVFRADPDLAPHPAASVMDYRGGKYVPVLLAARYYDNVSVERAASRNVASNVAPMHPELRKGLWKSLKAAARYWLRWRGGGYVVSGPAYLGSGAPRTLGPGKVQVPTHFYKIILVKDDKRAWQSLTFLVPNEKPVLPLKWQTYVKSIAEVEKATGVDLLPKLPPTLRARVAKTTSRMWPVNTYSPWPMPPGKGYVGGTVDSFPKARVILGTPKVKGDLDITVVQALIKSKLAEFRYCYRTLGLPLNHRLRAKGTMTLKINYRGRIGSLQIRPGTYDFYSTTSCISRQLWKLRFPKLMFGKKTMVTYPFELRP